MPITPGTKLGPYEVTAPIGAGGMGEVYRARDTKLGRDVAIKALPAEVAEEPERLARFRREAQLLASLNHPHIASIYGLEEVGGVPFLILELVEGEDLSDVLRRGPLAVDEAMDIARQVTEALEEAHEKGVVHRDLKPGNIKVTADGKVKVLDFGLAKAFAGDPTEGSSTDLSQSPTMTRATAAGVILGTAAYMSPEQARGKPVDKRADIFSFGCVLYEMLTGRQPFSGEMVSDILASILKTEPDWYWLPANIPPRLEQLVRRCLEKDPKKRWRDIGDVRVEIDHVLSHPGDDREGMVPEVEVKARKNPLAVAALAALLAGGMAGIAAWNLKPSPPKPLLRFGMVLPEGEQFTSPGRHLVALSPDGTRIAYVANNQLYLRTMNQMEAVPIRGTEDGARSPFFSPDGQWVGFWSDGMLKKVPATGGAPVSLCEAGNYGASWAQDDTIVFGQGPEGILRVSANGGPPEIVVPLDTENGVAANGPQILPGGTSLLFSLNHGGAGNWVEAHVVVQSLETGEQRILVEGGSDARYVPTGHLVYASGDSLLAVPFDLARLEVTGGPVPVVEDVMRSPAGTGAVHLSFSDSGSLVYVSESGQADRRLVRVDRQGKVTSLTDKRGDYYHPRLSPDGKRLAVSVDGKEGDEIWIHDLDRDTLTRLTTDGSSVFPTWSPDGDWVVYSSGGTRDLYRKRADFSGEAELLLAKETGQFPMNWSPDGKWLLFTEADSPGTPRDVWVLRFEGESESEAQPLLRSDFDEAYPIVSPNGRWLAYQSDESGQDEVYVQPFPDLGKRHQISTDGGREPIWSANGRELFYHSGLEMMAVEVEIEHEFRAGAPRMLFEGTYSFSRFGLDYDIAPDSESFVMIQASGAASGREQINVVLNWFEELKRLVPTDN